MKLFGLLGSKLTHSFSINYFTEKFQREGLTGLFEYRNFELTKLNGFQNLLAIQQELCGLNVTIPFKEQIIPYLNNVDAIAAETGAVNTIRIQRDNQGNVLFLEGFNTDAIGFRSALEPLILPHHKGALILGNGGAAKAVQYVMGNLGIPFLTVTRSADSNLSFDEVNEELLHRFPVIINTTPLGTFPNTEDSPPLPYHFINSENLLFDLVYNPEMTTFMKQGLKKGAKVENGLKMLHGQAEASWKIWNS